MGDLPSECYEEDVADYNMIDMTTLGGEQLRIVFNLILDAMCEGEVERRVGMEQRKVSKKFFQECVKGTAMDNMMKQWGELCSKIRRRRGQGAHQEEMEEGEIIEQEEEQATLLRYLRGDMVEMIERRRRLRGTTWPG